eukprot:scpid32091/ scgid0937/ 
MLNYGDNLLVDIGEDDLMTESRNGPTTTAMPTTDSTTTSTTTTSTITARKNSKGQLTEWRGEVFLSDGRQAEAALSRKKSMVDGLSETVSRFLGASNGHNQSNPSVRIYFFSLPISTSLVLLLRLASYYPLQRAAANSPGPLPMHFSFDR